MANLSLHPRFLDKFRKNKPLNILILFFLLLILSSPQHWPLYCGGDPLICCIIISYFQGKVHLKVTSETSIFTAEQTVILAVLETIKYPHHKWTVFRYSSLTLHTTSNAKKYLTIWTMTSKWYSAKFRTEMADKEAKKAALISIPRTLLVPYTDLINVHKR